MPGIPPRRPIQRYLFSPAARRVWVAMLGLLALFTLYMALTPKPPDQLSLGWDKANHAVTFALLAFVGVFALHGVAAAARRLVAGLFALGAAIELVQNFVPGRRGDWPDLLADGLGIALGLALGTLVARRFERRRLHRAAAAAAAAAAPSGR